MFWFKPIKTEWIVLTQPVVFLNLLFLGLIASMLCYIMWNTTVKQLGVIRATNYIYIVPLVTLLTSAIVIDETITMIGLLGSVLILNGVYVAERGVNAFKFLSRWKDRIGGTDERFFSFVTYGFIGY